MPLAGAIAIGFSAPLFAAVISIVFLKERADGPRFAALGAGFLGVVVVTRPGVDSLQIGALFALMNAAMYGSVTVAVRGMTKTESTLTLLMWQLAVVAAGHAALLVFGFRMPAAADAGLLVASGVANVAAQALWTRSLRLGPTAAVSPFYYLMLVWALLIGFLVWGDRPAPSLIAGSAIVVASGLALLWRETRGAPGTRLCFAGFHKIRDLRAVLFRTRILVVSALPKERYLRINIVNIFKLPPLDSRGEVLRDPRAQG